VSKWEKVKLGDIYSITSGGTPSKARPEYYVNGTIPWVRTGDLKDKYITHVDGSITDLGLKNSSAKLFPKGTVLIAMYGATIGACSILSIEAATNQACAAFLPNDRVDSSYLYYFLKSKKNELVSMGVGGAQPNISATLLKDVEFFIPPLEIQKQVVETLDTVLELQFMYKQQLVELDNLIKSTFYDMFGDPMTNEKGYNIKTIEEIAEGKLSYGSGASAVAYNGETRYIRITDINEDGTLNKGVVSPSEIDKRYLLNDGDILFARSGATVGKTFRYRSCYGNCIYAGYLIRLIPNKNLVHPDYVYSFTKTKYYQEFIESNKKVVAQPNINAQQYGKLAICVPPLSEQLQFVTIFSKIEAQKTLIKKAIDETQLLFDSLMSQYFDE